MSCVYACLLEQRQGKKPTVNPEEVARLMQFAMGHGTVLSKEVLDKYESSLSSLAVEVSSICVNMIFGIFFWFKVNK
jgi:hypothetical protein